jgi:hypothetical protein
MTRDFSNLQKEVNQIKETNPNIAGQDLIKELSKKGWTLSQYRNIFLEAQDMWGFFGIR